MSTVKKEGNAKQRVFHIDNEANQCQVVVYYRMR